MGFTHIPLLSLLVVFLPPQEIDLLIMECVYLEGNYHLIVQKLVKCFSCGTYAKKWTAWTQTEHHVTETGSSIIYNQTWSTLGHPSIRFVSWEKDLCHGMKCARCNLHFRDVQWVFVRSCQNGAELHDHACWSVTSSVVRGWLLLCAVLNVWFLALGIVSFIYLFHHFSRFVCTVAWMKPNSEYVIVEYDGIFSSTDIYLICSIYYPADAKKYSLLFLFGLLCPVSVSCVSSRVTTVASYLAAVVYFRCLQLYFLTTSWCDLSTQSNSASFIYL